MATSSIGGLSSTTTNSIRGYGGLASGMDRDTLIEGMTYGTTSKITQQQQKKTKLEWQQTAVRSISDMMISFANKYTATMTSTTNLFSSAFWGRSDITASGENSKYVSVSGSASSADAITVMGVKQLAKSAKWTSASSVSDGKLQTGNIDTTATQTVQNLEGKSIEFKYGNTAYSIFLEAGDDYDYSDASKVAESINKLLEKEEVSSGKKLSDIIQAEAQGNKIVFKDVEGNGNGIYLTGGTALSYLGFDTSSGEQSITTAGLEGTEDVKDLTKEVSFAERIAGKSLTFSYNGTTKTVKMPGKDELQGSSDVLSTIQSSLQEQLDSAFGKGRINVSTENGGLVFKTMNPATGAEDASSTFTLTAGDSALVGANGALNIKVGESNRVNLNAKLSESGLKLNGTTSGTIKINGTEIEVTADDTVQSLMDKINKNTDVTISYQAAADKFTVTSNLNGASGSIKFEGDTNLLDGIFGAGTSAAGEIRGQDAIVAVKYGNSDEVVELIRDSNSFTVDGMTVGVKGEFGYMDDGSGNKVLDPATEEVNFTAKVNTDSIVSAIKSMVEEFNAIVELVNKELTTKPDSDYSSPLTSEQRSELSESEIKLYEEKAKQGLLYCDSDLRALSDDLYMVISGGNAEALRAIGISTSTSYTDNGKLVLDESKLRAALEADPESVENLFTSKASADGSSNGVATNLQSIMDKYVKTMGATKGILIEKAGSSSAPLSLTTNSIYKEIAEINKVIEKLQTRLEAEQDRYISQFTALETLISQMNSQSSWLSQFTSY